MAIMFAVRDRLVEGYTPRSVPSFRTVKKKGVLYDTGGQQVELFRVKVLADSLDRTVAVLKQWEREKNLPPPTFKVEGDQCTHWYSAYQVINCHRIMYGRYRGRKYLPTEELKRFFEDIKKVWESTTVVVSETGDLEA